MYSSGVSFRALDFIAHVASRICTPASTFDWPNLIACRCAARPEWVAEMEEFWRFMRRTRGKLRPGSAAEP